MKYSFIALVNIFVLLSLIACSSSSDSSRRKPARSIPAPGGDLYHDIYKNNVYTCPDIGFSLTFNKKWVMYEHYNQLAPAVKVIADQFRANPVGGEMMLLGKLNNLLWLRVSVERTDMAVQKYFPLLRNINAKDIVSDSNKVISINGKEMIEWIFVVHKRHKGRTLKIKFREFLVRKGEYNLRISFWSHISLLDNYYGDIAKVISSYRTY